MRAVIATTVTALIASFAALVATLAAPTAASVDVSTERPTVRTFDRDWIGHTRHAAMPQRRVLKEVAYSGCCELGLRVSYRLSNVRRDGRRIVARAVVLRTKYASWIPRRDRLRRGDVRRVWIRNHMLHTPSTFYCQTGYRVRSCGA